MHAGHADVMFAAVIHPAADGGQGRVHVDRADSDAKHVAARRQRLVVRGFKAFHAPLCKTFDRRANRTSPTCGVEINSDVFCVFPNLARPRYRMFLISALSNCERGNLMERRSIAIHGTVQGVGFRPFVYNLAAAFDLGGFVRNYTGGVAIEVEGESETLDQFVRAIVSNPPPLARIERWSCEQQTPKGDRHFQIRHSSIDPAASIVIAADTATCQDCVDELLDPGNRRYRYPFLNCTNCGPRLSIVTGAPYDRAKTTMAHFVMCPHCRAEYEDPTNRRFHAQPTACAACGPSLTALDSNGHHIDTVDPLGYFVAAIRSGKIGALKGLGGYHLVCDARNSQAVAELRRRKHRDEKPLAIMVGDMAAAESLCEIDSEVEHFSVP